MMDKPLKMFKAFREALHLNWKPRIALKLRVKLWNV